MLLSVTDLCITYAVDKAAIPAVHNISFSLERGQTLGLIGESGSGKSTCAMALPQLLPSAGHVSNGTALFHGVDLLTLSHRDIRKRRGNDIGVIFQDPMTSLNPYMRIEQQLTEHIRLHLGYSRKEAIKHAIQMLETVEIPQAATRIQQFPHEFSGGQRQRIMIAMALCCNPSLLIADEPTTALDVTIQADILDLLKKIQHTHDMGILLITHDFGVVAGMCDTISVMKDGSLIESGSCNEIFYQPQQTYTQELLAAVPRIDKSNEHGVQP